MANKPRKPGDAAAADEEFGIVEFCSGKDGNDRPVYCYVSIPPSKYEAYFDMVASGAPFDPATFGTIIKSGEGKAPAKDIRLEMERVYNISHNFESTIEEKLQRLADTLHKKNLKKKKE